MSTEAKHTPGPWAYSGSVRDVDGDKLFCGSVYPVDDTIYRGNICGLQSADYIGGINIQEAEANASLIAAAPDLLAALQRVYHTLEAIGDLPSMRAEIAVIIAKAVAS